MPWSIEEKYFLRHLSFKNVQDKICRKFNLNNYPEKSQIYRWVHKFQATESVNNLNERQKI